MPTSSAYGAISVSIDAEAVSLSSPPALEAIESVAVELFDRFRQESLPATWVVADPRQHPLASRIARHGGNHELAVYGGSAIGANAVARTDAQRSLLSRLLDCHRAGLKVTTVTENSAWQPHDIDLLAKRGISMIRSSLSSRTHRVQAIRYGLWRLPTSASLQGGSWLPYFAQSQMIRKTIEQTLRIIGICHLRIDAPSIARTDIPGGLRSVERLLEYLGQLRAARHVTIENLHQAALRMQPKRTLTAARSILRAA